MVIINNDIITILLFYLPLLWGVSIVLGHIPGAWARAGMRHAGRLEPVRAANTM